MFSGAMRNGLHGRLVKAGVPYGLAALIAEANYPGGEYGGLVNCAPKGRARDLTQGFLERGVYSLEQAARGIFGSDYHEAIAFSQEVDGTASFIGQVRGGEVDVQSGSRASSHLPSDSFFARSDPEPGHLPTRESSPAEPPLPPEGWYDDPDEPSTSLRWWNGSRWTEDRQPK